MMGEVTQSPIRSSALHVLVVDDNTMCQTLAKAVLERNGHVVTIAENGRAAVNMIEVSSFDLILMDIMMPEMDGLQATREIRKREKRTGTHVPIVAVTAASDREQCLAGGMDEFIAKPIRSGELAAVIERVLV